MNILKYFKNLYKQFTKYFPNMLEADVPIMEQATPLQKFLISVVISGNIRKG